MAECMSEDVFICPICLCILTNPVSIPCGHSYCMNCIKDCWGKVQQGDVYSCPQCRTQYPSKPALNKNTTLAEAVENVKTSRVSFEMAAAGDAVCNFCSGEKHKAVKTCLTCVASYCEEHIKNHYENPALKKHKVQTSTVPLKNITCTVHQRHLDTFCRTDQSFICLQCIIHEHKDHDCITAKSERDRKKKHYGETQKVIQQRMQSKQKEVDHLKKTIETVKTSAGNEKMEVRKLCDEWADLIHTIGLNVSTVVEKKENDVVSHAEELVKQLEAEVCELKRRNTELMELGKIEDHAHFLQKFKTISTPPGNEDLPSISFKAKFSFEDTRKPIIKMKNQITLMWKNTFLEIQKTVNELKAYEVSPMIKKDLRIVILGKCGTGKSSAGNTLLGCEEFRIQSMGLFTSMHCIKRDTIIDDQNITVIDTPCLFNKEITSEINRSIELTSPGPHVFLIVLQAGYFTKNERQTVKILQEIFGEAVFKNAVILFTRGDDVSSGSIEVFIQRHKELKELLEMCGKRYHVFNNTLKEDNEQRKEFLEKINKMMQLNTGLCYRRKQEILKAEKTLPKQRSSIDQPPNMAESETIKPVNYCKCQNGITERSVTTPPSKTTKINDAIVHNKEVEPYSETEEHLRVALIGKCGSGRSVSGNTLLGREEFKSFIYNSTSTNESKKEKTQFDGTNVTVIDTPGLLDTRLPPEKVKEHLEQCIKISSPGIHAFLLVIQVGCFTIEEKKAVEEIKELYGDTVTKYMIILFTYADNLQGLTIQQYVNGANKDLRSLIELCEGRYHAINNKNPRNRMQVIELLDKIEQMVKQNGNTCYTLEMYQHAQKAISEKDQEIKRKCEEEHKRKEEAIRKKHEDDFKIKQIEFKKLFEGIKKKEEEIKKKSEEHQEKDELLKKNRIAERKAKEELKKTEEELKVQHDEAKKKDAELKKKYEEEQRQKEEEQRKKYEEEKRKEEIISKTEEEKLEKDLKLKYDEECKRKDTDLRMKFEENNKKEEEKIEKELASKCAEEVKKREEIERAKHLIDNKKALEELKNKLKGELGDKDFEKTFEEQKKKKEEEWLANLSQLLNKNAMEIRKKYDEEKKKGKEERKKAENDRYKVFIKAHEQERKLFEEELKKKNETERRKQNDTRNKRVQEKEAVFIKQQAELRERLENEKKQKENELKQKQEKENKKREEITGRLKAEYQKKQDETTKLQKEKQKVEEEISKLQQEKQIMEDKIK